jgi:citrate synthase
VLTRHEASGAALPADDAGWDALALEAVRQSRPDNRFVPGLGHPVHKVRDPRTPVLSAAARSGWTPT